MEDTGLLNARATGDVGGVQQTLAFTAELSEADVLRQRIATLDARCTYLEQQVFIQKGLLETIMPLVPELRQLATAREQYANCKSAANRPAFDKQHMHLMPPVTPITPHPDARGNVCARTSMNPTLRNTQPKSQKQSPRLSPMPSMKVEEEVVLESPGILSYSTVRPKKDERLKDAEHIESFDEDAVTQPPPKPVFSRKNILASDGKNKVEVGSKRYRELERIDDCVNGIRVIGADVENIAQLREKSSPAPGGGELSSVAPKPMSHRPCLPAIDPLKSSDAPKQQKALPPGGEYALRGDADSASTGARLRRRKKRWRSKGPAACSLREVRETAHLESFPEQGLGSGENRITDRHILNSGKAHAGVQDECNTFRKPATGRRESPSRPSENTCLDSDLKRIGERREVAPKACVAGPSILGVGSVGAKPKGNLKGTSTGSPAPNVNVASIPARPSESPWVLPQRRNDEWDTPSDQRLEKSMPAYVPPPPPKHPPRKYRDVTHMLDEVRKNQVRIAAGEAGLHNETVRGKQARVALDAGVCPECDEFFRSAARGCPDSVRIEGI